MTERRPLSALCACAVLALPLVSASGARADGTNLGECYLEDGPGPTSCSYDLVKGGDYGIRRASEQGRGTIELVNPAGVATVTMDASTDGATGQEFRAAYTGTYRLRLTSEPGHGQIGASVRTDCRGDVKTKCAVPLRAKVAGSNSYVGDRDWYRTAALVRSRTYTFTLDAPGHTSFVLRDPLGGELIRRHADGASKPGVIRYTARRAGAHYLEVHLGGTFTVGAR